MMRGIHRWGALAAVLGLFGCARAAAPAAPPVEPPPAPAPAPAPPPPPAAARPAGQPVELCILRDGDIATVEGTYDAETGDTLLNGRPWREAHPAHSPPYAAGVDWFIHGEMVSVPGRELALEKYGLTRVFGPRDVKRKGEYRGLPMFVEAEDTSPVPDVVYFMARPGCEFQPYLQAYSVGGVRGR